MSSRWTHLFRTSQRCSPGRGGPLPRRAPPSRWRCRAPLPSRRGPSRGGSRSSVPPGARGKGEDLVGHVYAWMCRLKKALSEMKSEGMTIPQVWLEGKFHLQERRTCSIMGEERPPDADSGDDARLTHYLSMLGDEEPSRRWKAAEGLALVGDPRGLGPLIAALQDEDWRVRRKAAWGARGTGRSPGGHPPPEGDGERDGRGEGDD